MLTNSVARQTRKIPSGNIYVDGVGIGDVGSIVLRDRKQLSEDGMLVIVITLSKEERTIISGPDTISRGFVYARESEELLKEINRLVTTVVNDLQEANRYQWNIMKQNIKKSIGQYVYAQTKKKPMILPIIIEV